MEVGTKTDFELLKIKIAAGGIVNYAITVLLMFTVLCGKFGWTIAIILITVLLKAALRFKAEPGKTTLPKTHGKVHR